MNLNVGYRHAQCGWVLVNTTLKERPQSVQCLCIYASRRGILEVRICVSPCIILLLFPTSLGTSGSVLNLVLLNALDQGIRVSALDFQHH